MLTIEKIIAHIPSTDMTATKEFFIKLFGFKVVVDTDYFIELDNNGYSLGILRASNEANEQSIYFQVTEIENLWEGLKDKLAKYKHRELFVQEYGMKEFHVSIPHSATLLFVGEPAES